MDIDTVNKMLSENIELYDRSIIGIRQCLISYEKECSSLIGEIANCTSFNEANSRFDALLKIQEKLAGLLFGRQINIGSKLECLTKEFDRLYDPYIREYWYNKFKQGTTWPE